MTQTIRHPMLATLATGITLAMVLAGGTAASAAGTSPTADIAQPDLVALLKDYENYYKPAEDYDKADPSSFGRGTVTELGKTVLGWNDRTTQNINNTAAAGSDGTTPTAQQKRALVDSDYNFEETFPDALGPVLGGYLSEGLKASANADGSVNPNGPLARTYRLLENDTADTASGSYANSLVSDWVDTSAAKNHFNHPRPYVDRTNGGYPAAGLATTLDIKRAPAWDGHDANYDGMVTSGSFPSGHTTYAYSGGIGLATLLPELGPEIMARASEAGNNRIVLGVHYSLDIMGGRIDGEVANARLWSDPTFRTDYLMPARQELESYLTGQCKAHNEGDTLEACIQTVGANGSKGYTNDFTDGIVNTEPVTDRASAIDAYTARMTYGFQRTGAKDEAPVVPEGASNLLLTAFPELTDAQRAQVLAASEIESGYPLDASSEGFQRLNLAKAYSANVVLSSDRATILGITFGNAAPSVTVVKSDDQLTNLLKGYTEFWTPGKGVNGTVGKAVLGHDDELTESINHAGAATAGTAHDQTARAYQDSKMNSTITLHDALGPVLGTYYQEGMDQGKLSKTADFLKAMNASASTGNAKNTYAHPRPYVDRTHFNGTDLDLQGLKSTLDITRIPAYENDNGVNQYDALAASGSFPSGHTTFAFTQGAGLSTLLPELGPEIMTRVSEAGNNRIVLGVHYPLDILGGHIAGQSGVAAALDDPAVKAESQAARTELVTYLTDRCKADGHGSTLDACIASTGANGAQGYTNAFTDDVSTRPVTDRASAIDAYDARMHYGFQQTGAAGQAPVVPDDAVNLLANVPAFQSLTTDQRRQVLAMTEGDSGYPLDDSSDGWARIDLTKAYSAKVTLSADGSRVVSVEPGQAEASVTRASAPSPSEQPGGSTKPGATPGATPGTTHAAGTTGSLSRTGAAAMGLGVAALVAAGAGVTLVLRRRRI